MSQKTAILLKGLPDIQVQQFEVNLITLERQLWNIFKLKFRKNDSVYWIMYQKKQLFVEFF